MQGWGALRRELAKSLRTGRALRKPRRKDGERRGRIAGMVNIGERPAEAADRAVPGHWEGDLLIGVAGTSAIGTLAEHTTRFTMLVPLPAGYDAPAMAEALTPVIADLPDALSRSLTWDQGREMKAHAQIAVAADCQICFCDPRSPWQRGTSENTNGLLRQYFPKSTPLAGYSPAHLAAVAGELNGRPRKTLGWKTPGRGAGRDPGPRRRLTGSRSYRWRLAPPLIFGCRVRGRPPGLMGTWQATAGPHWGPEPSVKTAGPACPDPCLPPAWHGMPFLRRAGPGDCGCGWCR